MSNPFHCHRWPTSHASCTELYWQLSICLKIKIILKPNNHLKHVIWWRCIYQFWYWRNKLLHHIISSCILTPSTSNLFFHLYTLTTTENSEKTAITSNSVRVIARQLIPSVLFSKQNNEILWKQGFATLTVTQKKKIVPGL